MTPTVAQALRPFPQYTNIDTWDGNGDHSGHSTYHAGVIKLDKRFAQGFTFTTSYVFSKILTDADSYWITDNPRAADHYNRAPGEVDRLLRRHPQLQVRRRLRPARSARARSA